MPGETFQTLKSKATKQAKKSGMSQSAAEKYGSARASQAAQVGGAVVPSPSGSSATFDPEFFGNTPTISTHILLEALSGSTAAPLEQIAARKEAEKKMQEAGGVYNPQTGEVEYPPKKEGIFNFSGFKMPTLQDIGIMGPAIKKLSPLQLEQAQNILSSYSPLEVGLLKSFILSRTNPISGFFGNKQLYSDMEGNIIDSTDVEEVGGKLINKKTGEEVRRTKEGIESQLKRIDPNIMESLKKFEEADYYKFMGMPQTSGSLQDLGALDATKYAGDADFQNMIYAAREATSRRNPQVQEGGEGIPNFAAAPTPFTDVNNNGILDNLEVAQATTTPVTATTPVTGIPSLTPTTINYASMAPQFGGYVNQGLMNPNLSPYYDNLRNYYGIG